MTRVDNAWSFLDLDLTKMSVSCSDHLAALQGDHLPPPILEPPAQGGWPTPRGLMNLFRLHYCLVRTTFVNNSSLKRPLRIEMIFMQVMKKSSNSAKSKLKMAARFQAAKKTTLSCQTLKETRPLQLIGRVWCKFSSGGRKGSET